MDSAISWFGLLVTIGGAVLMIGNVSGDFTTFPFAGFIVMTLGGFIVRAGKSEMEDELTEKVNRLLADVRYTEALRMFVDDFKQNEITPEESFTRATRYLVDRGVPAEQASEELHLLLSVFAASQQEAAKKSSVAAPEHVG